MVSYSKWADQYAKDMLQGETQRERDARPLTLINDDLLESN